MPFTSAARTSGWRIKNSSVWPVKSDSSPYRTRTSSYDVSEEASSNTHSNAQQRTSFSPSASKVTWRPRRPACASQEDHFVIIAFALPWRFFTAFGSTDTMQSCNCSRVSVSQRREKNTSASACIFEASFHHVIWWFCRHAASARAGCPVRSSSHTSYGGRRLWRVPLPLLRLLTVRHVVQVVADMHARLGEHPE